MCTIVRLELQLLALHVLTVTSVVFFVCMQWIDPAEKERLMQRYNVGPTRSNSRKQTDRNSQAVTLARKLYMLDGYRKSEVAEKLAQP